MNFRLKRTDYTTYGVFGELYDSDDVLRFVTLEHAYERFNEPGFVTKVAPGIYTCKLHEPVRLPYKTYELCNVPPFNGDPVDGILIHIGNFNKDSVGCILLGKEKTDRMITKSKEAFDEFMELQQTTITDLNSGQPCVVPIPAWSLTIEEST